MASILYIHGDEHEVNGYPCNILRVPFAEDVPQFLAAGYVAAVEELYADEETEEVEQHEEQAEETPEPETQEEPEEQKEDDDELEELKQEAKALKVKSWHLFTDKETLRAKIEEAKANQEG